MATTNIRSAFSDALVTALKAHASLSGVQVEPGWPGDELEGEAVWLDEITGDMAFPLLKAGRKPRNDVFTVPVELQAGNAAQTLSEARNRCGVFLAALEDVLANDPTLSSLDGVLWTEPGTVRGPFPIRTKQGAVGFCRAEIVVHSRLS